MAETDTIIEREAWARWPKRTSRRHSDLRQAFRSGAALTTTASPTSERRLIQQIADSRITEDSPYLWRWVSQVLGRARGIAARQPSTASAGRTETQSVGVNQNMTPAPINLGELERLRDQFAVAAYPAALADALRGYGHICPFVTEGAIRRAYECADAAISFRQHLPPPPDTTTTSGE